MLQTTKECRSQKKPFEADAASMRTCVFCRKARDVKHLLPLSMVEGRIVVAKAVKRRGAWVCIRRVCLSSLQPGKLSAALRTPVSLPEGHKVFLQQLECLARLRVLEMIGLARRQNALSLGVDEVNNERAQHSGLALLASDASTRTRNIIGSFAREFVSSEEMSKAAGVYNVQAVFIKSDRLSQQAAYWWSVWHESASLG